MADIAKFGIEIEANTKGLDDVEKKIDSVEKKVTESTKKAEKSVNSVTQAVRKEGEEVEKTGEKHLLRYKNIIKQATIFSANLLAIKKITSAVFGYNAEAEGIGRLAKMANVSTDSIQDLGKALENYGGSASSASSTLSKLNKQMADLRIGKGGTLGKVIMQYGLDTSAKTPEQMLLNIAKRMQGMGALQQVNFGRALGLDNPTIMLLQQGVEGVRKELEKAKEYRLYEKEDIENAEKFQRTLREFRGNLSKIANILLKFINPVVARIVEYLKIITDKIREHPDLIKKVAGSFALIMTILSPFSALLAGIGLLLDDIITSMRGGESWINWKKGVDIVRSFYGWVEKIFKTFNDLNPLLKILLTYIAFLVTPLGGFVGLLTFLYMLASTVSEVITSFVLWLTDFDWSAIGDAIKDAFLKAIETIKGWWTSFIDWIKGSESADDFKNGSLITDALNPAVAPVGSNWLQQADAFPLNSIGSGTISNINNAKATTQTLHIDTLNLQTQAKDGASILGGLQTELSGMVGNMGVATQ